MEASAKRAFAVMSKHRMLSHYLPKLKACLAHLNEGLIWQREADGLNSIGGIVMHVLEHMNRNIVRLGNPAASFTQGIESFFPDAGLDKASLIETLDRTFEAFEQAMNDADPGGVDMYGMYHLVEHAGYHIGQIVDRTQRLTDVRLQFVQNGIHEKALRRLVDEELSK